MDGASSWGRFWHVTLPLIKPVLGVVILFSTIFTFADFNIVQVLTRGGPINTTHLFATLAYQVGLQGGNLGQGAAISLFIFPLLAAGGVLPAPLRQEGVAMATARSRGARIRSNVFAYANLAPYVFFVLFPFYFMIVTSFKSNAELYNLKSIPFWIQSGAIMDHYALLFQKTDFVTWMKNSLLVAVVATTVSVVISILAGYSLARLRFRGAAAFGTAIFITYLVPPTLLFLPLSQVVVWLGLADSIYALMVIYPTFLVPVLHLAAHGLLPHHPARGRGVRARGRGHPHADAVEDRAADGHPRDHLRRALQLHALLERVHLRADLHLAVGEQDRGGGRHRRT